MPPRYPTRRRALMKPEAFMAAIASDPDADRPRLLFADWLEKNKQPDRAELIRLSCQFDPLRDRLGDEAADALRDQVDQLLASDREAEFQWLLLRGHRSGAEDKLSAIRLGYQRQAQLLASRAAEEGGGCGGEVAGEAFGAVAVEDAEEQGPGVEIDAGVESGVGAGWLKRISEPSYVSSRCT